MSKFGKNVDTFSIEWSGMKEFNEMLDVMSKEHEQIIAEELTDYGKLVERGTKELVHHDEGYLHDSINFDKARRFGASFEVVGGSNMAYALRRHEEQYRPGTHDKLPGDSFYKDGLGRTTRRKTPWRGYKPGRKFLENSIKATEQDYNRMNERVLDRIMRLSK